MAHLLLLLALSQSPALGADAALRARGNREEMERLAARADPDPWLVVDELRARGEADAAREFAALRRSDEGAALREFAARPLPGREEAALREALRLAQESIDRQRGAEALERLEGAAGAPEGVLASRIGVARGLALQLTGALDRSVEAFEEAATAAERLGWLRGAAEARRGAAETVYLHEAFDRALPLAERAVEVATLTGAPGELGQALSLLGALESGRGEVARGRACLERALPLLKESGDLPAEIVTLNRLGTARSKAGATSEAIELHRRARALAESGGYPRGLVTALAAEGGCLLRRGDFAGAADLLQRALSVAEEGKWPDRMAEALTELGSLEYSRGNPLGALEVYRRAVEEAEKCGRAASADTIRVNIAASKSAAGDPRSAIADLREILGRCEGKSPSLEQLAQANLGTILWATGRYAEALARHERSLEIGRSSGDSRLVALALGNVATLHAEVRHSELALRFAEEGLSLCVRIGDRLGEATALNRLAATHAASGNLPKAVELNDRALRIAEELGDPATIVNALSNRAAMRLLMGDRSGALEGLQKALSACRELSPMHQALLRPGILLGIGTVHFNSGDFGEAEKWLRECETEAAGSGARKVSAEARYKLVLTRLGKEDPRESLEALRSAVSDVGAAFLHFGDEEGARGRASSAHIFDLGVGIASILGDVDELFWYMEQGRAAKLIEGLGAPAALLEAALPVAVRLEESRLRAAEAAAARALEERTDAAGRAVREKALLDARERRRELVERIQRTARVSASLVCPQIPDLETVQAELKEGEALVLYGIHPLRSCALVATKMEASVVPLAKADEIRRACEAVGPLGIAPHKRNVEPAESIRRLRELLVDPLPIPEGTARLLVSPSGPLGHVPFPALFPEMEWCFLPSATVYALLAADPKPEGEGVLALGDPDYRSPADVDALRVFSRGDRLSPLPATREEALAVGDEVLLGAEATSARLEAALRGRARWRAVHLACHGVVNAERPSFSYLALSGSVLSCLDVFRMRIPADLVVLSACETGLGRVYEAEGLLGWTRAFLFAGSPRVIVSLWKVDDAATAALMKRFYASWNPKDPAKRKRPSQALLEAQRSVASEPAWKDPYYWAAWQLWGLPD